MSIVGIVIVVILVLAVFGSLPRWPYSGSWGYYPSSVIGIVLLFLIILLLAGTVHI